VVFSSDRADGQTLQLWLMRVTLTDQGLLQAYDFRQLTDGPGDKTQAAWSPDGTELIYVAPGEGNNGLDLWKMPVDGSAAPVNLTELQGNETNPAWSSDGQLIAFTSDKRSDGILQLYLIDSNGGGLRRLSFDQEEYDAVWSPDMDWMAFVLNAGGFRLLYLRSPQDAKAPAGATPVPAYYVTPQAYDRSTLLGQLGDVSQPVWSPNGEWIAYTRQDGSRKGIYLAKFPLRLPDQEIIRLTDGTRDNTPTWSSDSQWLAYTSFRGENEEIFLMRSTGQTQTNLTDDPARDLDPAWKP
jgi:TolB protein